MRRRSNAPRDEPEAERRPASGTPAPLSQDQVDALIRGRFDSAEMAGILDSHRQPPVEGRSRPARKRAPVALNEADLEELSVGGRTPDELAERLDRAAKEDRSRLKPTDARRRRPRRRPPQ